MTRQVRLTVSEHAPAGSSLFVLRDALLREVARNVRRGRAAKSPRGRLRAANDLRAALRLAEEAGCSHAAISEAAR